MKQPHRRVCLFFLVALLTVGCAGAPQPTSQSNSSGPAPAVSTAPKIVTMGVLYDDETVRGNRFRPFPQLVVAEMTIQDDKGERHPQLAEAVPSAENGLWKLFPDGTMELTWRLREGARWHDGRPITSEDLLFTTMLARDRELPGIWDPAYDLIDAVDAPDARTIRVHWRQPNIDAVAMFGRKGFVVTSPVPKHILEHPYLENKEGFLDLPFWSGDLVSSGPYKVREWIPGQHVLLDAFPGYALGRPKIDQIVVRIITDPNTLLANVLSGAVDMTGTQAVSIDMGVTASEMWRGGKMFTYFEQWAMMYPQLRAPTPAALADPPFRKAVMHAIDRQELADTLGAGLTSVAHSIISPDQAEYPYVEKSIVRYDYDPRRTVQMIEGMGFSRGPDGVFRDGAGQRMTIEVRATQNDLTRKIMLSVSDALGRVGLPGEPVPIPPSGTTPAWDYSFPGFRVAPQGHGVDGVYDILHSSAAPLPERNYRAPNSAKNRGSYVNPEYDALMDRYKVTIPMNERMELLAQIVHMQTDLALVFGLFYNANAILISDRLQNVPRATAWNAHLWDVN